MLGGGPTGGPGAAAGIIAGIIAGIAAPAPGIAPIAGIAPIVGIAAPGIAGIAAPPAIAGIAAAFGIASDAAEAAAAFSFFAESSNVPSTRAFAEASSPPSALATADTSETCASIAPASELHISCPSLGFGIALASHTFPAAGWTRMHGPSVGAARFAIMPPSTHFCSCCAVRLEMLPTISHVALFAFAICAMILV